MVDELGLLLNKVPLEGRDGGDVVALDETQAEEGESVIGICLVEKMIVKKPTNLEAMKSVS